MTALQVITNKAVGMTAAVMPMISASLVEEGASDTSLQRPSASDQLEIHGEVVALQMPIHFEGWFQTRMQIPGTDAFISFKKPPRMTMRVAECVMIDDWGIRLSFNELSPESIQRRVVGQYLRLAEHARRQILTDEERKFWNAIVSDSDYAAFCQQTAPMTAIGGIRIGAAKRDAVRVAWNGCDEEILTGVFAQQLSIVEDGEEFSARGKFIDGMLAALSNVTPLGKPTPIDLDELFESA